MQKNRKEKFTHKKVNAHYLGKNVRFDLWAYDSKRRRYDANIDSAKNAIKNFREMKI